MDDARCQNVRLPGSRAGDDEQRSGTMLDRESLFRLESLKNVWPRSPSLKLSCSVISSDGLGRNARPDRGPPRHGEPAEASEAGGTPWRREGFGRGELYPTDSPCVLLSGVRQALRKGNKRANGWTLWPFGGVRPISIEPEGAGDVEVRPLRSVLDG